MTMKLNLRFHSIPDSDANRKLITSDLEPLQTRAGLAVSNATVKVEKSDRGGPAYRAEVHLEVPGPDLRASASDFTLAAAWRKVMQALQKEISRRVTQRKARRPGRSGTRAGSMSPSHA